MCWGHKQQHALLKLVALCWLVVASKARATQTMQGKVCLSVELAVYALKGAVLCFAVVVNGCWC